MEDAPGERHLNIHFTPEVMAGVYANFANVSHSDYEFTITFARIDHEVEEEEVPGVVVSRVNLSPRFMKELRSEEHTSELQSQFHLVCRLLLEKKKKELKTLPQSSEAFGFTGLVDNFRTNTLVLNT